MIAIPPSRPDKPYVMWLCGLTMQRRLYWSNLQSNGKKDATKTLKISRSFTKLSGEWVAAMAVPIRGWLQRIPGPVGMDNVHSNWTNRKGEKGNNPQDGVGNRKSL